MQEKSSSDLPSNSYIYTLNVLVYDKEAILVAVHFSMQNIELSGDLGHTLERNYVMRLPVMFFVYIHLQPASVAQLDAPSDWRPGGRGFNPRRGRQHSFVEIDHEIFSMVILSLPLIQEGQLSVSGERMCTILVNCLED